jgi:hypothetical protein
MPKRSTKRSNKRRTRKQKPVLMIGCSSSKKRNNKSHRNIKGGLCPKCGTKCQGNSCPKCGTKCQGNSCPKCGCNCYLNHRYKGGAGCGSSGCPIAPLSIKQMNNLKGGTCQTCSNIQLGGKIPPPFVPSNSAWGPNVHKWPGVDGVPNSRNYLSPYNSDNNPQLQMSMDNAGYKTPNSLVGGKKGGGLIPQDFVNLGRDFSFNFKSAYNALNGYKSPVEPAPYKGQLTGALNNNNFLF